MMKKNSKRTIALLSAASGILLAQTACNKSDAVIPLPPAADAANNVCVISQYYGTNAGNIDCANYDSTYADSDGTNAVNALETPLVEGIDAQKYAILNTGYTLYNNNSCTGTQDAGYTDSNGNEVYNSYTGPSGDYGMLAWVEYDCRGVAVNTNVFGPYPSGVLDSEQTTLTPQVLAANPGYKISYVSYEPVASGSDMDYIVFYIYKPSAVVDMVSNQGTVVDALNDAKTFNTLTLSSSTRSLSDTLTAAGHFDPSIIHTPAYRLAREILSIQAKMRSNSARLVRASTHRSSRSVPARFSFDRASSRLPTYLRH